MSYNPKMSYNPQFSNLSFFTTTKKAVIFITAFSLVTQERFELPTP